MPISSATCRSARTAIEQAIELNGAAVEMSRNAFRFGRLAAHEPGAVERMIGAGHHHPAEAADAGEPRRLPRRASSPSYQDAALAERYRARVARMAEVERKQAPGRTGLAEAVARGYYKLLAYKDEYEVARLLSSPAFEKALGEQFEAAASWSSTWRRRCWRAATRPPASRARCASAPGCCPCSACWPRARACAARRWDVFGYTAERKLERQMIADYEKLLDEIAQRLSPATHATAVALASLPLDVKGFGHIKDRNYKIAKQREAVLLAELRNPSPPTVLKAAE